MGSSLGADGHLDRILGPGLGRIPGTGFCPPPFSSCGSCPCCLGTCALSKCIGACKSEKVSDDVLGKGSGVGSVFTVTSKYPGPVAVRFITTPNQAVPRVFVG